VAEVEAAGNGVSGIDVDADASGVMLDEPGSKMAEECGGNAGAAVFRKDVDPLEFAMAIVAASEMASDEAGEDSLAQSNERNTSRKRLLRVMRAGEIAGDAELPALEIARVECANGGDGGDFVEVCGPDEQLFGIDRHWTGLPTRATR
jgi:hypothetical protein